MVVGNSAGLIPECSTQSGAEITAQGEKGKAQEMRVTPRGRPSKCRAAWGREVSFPTPAGESAERRGIPSTKGGLPAYFPCSKNWSSYLCSEQVWRHNQSPCRNSHRCLV